MTINDLIDLVREQPKQPVTQGVDWTMPIEAVHKITGEVVPMEYSSQRSGMNGLYRITKTYPHEDSNEYWNEDGSDCCSGPKSWYIRNVKD